MSNILNPKDRARLIRYLEPYYHFPRDLIFADDETLLVAVAKMESCDAHGERWLFKPMIQQWIDDVAERDLIDG